MTSGNQENGTWDIVSKESKCGNKLFLTIRSARNTREQREQTKTTKIQLTNMCNPIGNINGC